eukprot:jgi/Chlat1/1834/Chrsp14S08699
MADFPKRRLGKNGPLVSAIGFGAMGLSEFYGPASDEKDAIELLNLTIDKGCTFWDTASNENEKLLAKVLKHRRNEVFLATKFGVVRTPGSGDFVGYNGKPAYVKESCNASLQRLGVEQIDLYYQHRKDPDTEIEDTMRALKELVEEGKIKYIGLSECSADTIRRAHAVHPISAYQVEYSPWTLDIETNGTLKACRELGIAVVAYSPLGRGILTGQYRSLDDFAPDDFRRFIPRWQGDNFRKNLDLVDKFKELADKKGCTLSQMTLAWLLAQGDDIIPIPGTRKVKYLLDNLGAVNVKIESEDDRAIRDIIASIGDPGERYPAAMMSALETSDNNF